MWYYNKIERRRKGSFTMNIIESLIYGAVQGLAEFLPISSSGHLAIFHALLGDGDATENLAFDVLLHLGTLVAVMIVYRRDIWQLITSFFSLIGKLFHKNFKFSSYTEGERFVILVLIATLPLIPAALLDHYIEAVAGSLLAVGIILIVNSVMLYMSDLLPHGSKGLYEMTPKNALIVGLSQMIAVFPGLSRSGTTITVGLTQNLTREFAVKFSFIMSIPAILGACVLKIPDFVSTVATEDPSSLGIYFAGALTAGIVGVLAMKLLQFIAKRSTFKYFSIYSLAVGVGAVIYSIVR